MEQPVQPGSAGIPPSRRQLLLELRLRQQQADKAGATLKPRTNQAPAPLTHTQRRAWFLAQLDPDSIAYHEARAYHLSGRLDITALKECLLALITRHEILRTTFVMIGDEPGQLVHDEPAVDLEVLDRTSRDGLERGSVLAETLAETRRSLRRSQRRSLRRSQRRQHIRWF